jgi:DNA-binding Lrp family transcriptional regulator
MKAYVLVQNSGHGEPLAGKLEAIPEVVSAQDVSGAYDAIAVVRSSSLQELTDVVLAEIRRLPGVTHAIPAPLIGSWREHRAA